ncbi:hypothetical protein SAMN05216417_10513 [Nitrosospira multiformis]|uniref:Uncharacterized protein n=1 Tax=Nitrosospira multiformis TaxID=1231 RepID=A0A1I7GJS3_9PROT|nr:hypothetical protein SAMN05216417_10513 [Nitrosospira multiformis]
MELFNNVLNPSLPQLASDEQSCCSSCGIGTPEVISLPVARRVSEAHLQGARSCVEGAHTVLCHLHNQLARRSNQYYRCLFLEDVLRAPREDPENRQVEICRLLLASGVKAFSRLSQLQLPLRPARRIFPIGLELLDQRIRVCQVIRYCENRQSDHRGLAAGLQRESASLDSQ